MLTVRSAELLGESDEKPFRPADVAEPIHVFVLDDFADELRAALAEPFKRLVQRTLPDSARPESPVTRSQHNSAKRLTRRERPVNHLAEERASRQNAASTKDPKTGKKRWKKPKSA